MEPESGPGKQDSLIRKGASYDRALDVVSRNDAKMEVTTSFPGNKLEGIFVTKLDMLSQKVASAHVPCRVARGLSFAAVKDDPSNVRETEPDLAKLVAKVELTSPAAVENENREK